MLVRCHVKVKKGFPNFNCTRGVSHWCRVSVFEAAEALAKGHITSKELTQHCIDQIESTRHFNMFVRDNFEQALALAEASDKRRTQQKCFGLMDGIPIGVKDIFCTKGVETSAASNILENFVPPYESTATEKLLNAGAIPLGKLNMDEFAMGSGTIYSKFGATINPWSEDTGEKAVVSGGSSGASAAAVASGCCFATLGSDTGGSVRQPAAYCGVVGLKPNYGRVSRHGMIAFASSLDTPGIFARTVKDTALVLNTIAGSDMKDSTCMTDEIPDNWCIDDTHANDKPLKGITVGIPKEYHVKEMSSSIVDVWDNGIKWLIDAGATVVSVSLSTTKHALPVYYTLACAEASSNLSRYDGVRYGLRETHLSRKQSAMSNQMDDLDKLYSNTRSKGFGDEVKRRILSGSFVLSAGAFTDYYERAVVVRQKITDDFAGVFNKGVDVLLTPTTPSGPFGVNIPSDPVEMYLNDIMTIPASLAGLPAISVPVALTTNDSSGLPLGLQVISAPQKEENVVKVAAAIEKFANFGDLVPSRVYDH